MLEHAKIENLEFLYAINFKIKQKLYLIIWNIFLIETATIQKTFIFTMMKTIKLCLKQNSSKTQKDFRQPMKIFRRFDILGIN